MEHEGSPTGLDLSHARGASGSSEVPGQEKIHNSSPGRAARLVLRKLTRNLGRADTGLDTTAATAAALPGSDRVERARSELSLIGGGQGVRPPRDEEPAPCIGHLMSRAGSNDFADPGPTNAPTGRHPTAASPPANQRRVVRHAHADPRTVQPSAAPRSVPAVPPTHAQTLRRRGRGAMSSASTSSAGEPFSARAGAGAGGAVGVPGRATSARDPCDGHEAGWRPNASATASSAVSGTKERLSRRSPFVRYLVLSVLLVAVGLTLRYLWRQVFSGLAGALVILAAARRWMGSGDASANPGRVGDERARRSLERTDRSLAAAKPALGRVMSNGPIEEVPPSLGDDGAAVGKGEGEGDGGGQGAREEWGGAFAGAPPGLRRYWKDGGPDCKFVVRGPNYMSDRKKIPAGPAVMRLVHVDLFNVENEMFHVASKGRCRDRISAFSTSFEDRGETPPFLFILNILVPGEPVVSTVMYWALEEQGEGGGEGSSDEAAASRAAFIGMLERYAEVPGSGYKKLDRRRSSCPETPPSRSNSSSSQQNPAQSPTSSAVSAQDVPASSVCHADGSSGTGGGGSDGAESSENSPPSTEAAAGEGSPLGSSRDQGEVTNDPRTHEGGLLPEDDFRNQRFKLIPSIVSGPFMVRKAVGNKPALLGRKLNQRYFRGPGYVETDVDVGSSIVAEKIVALCRGYARSLTVELGICMEGRSVEELPEKCIGVIRLVNLDLDGAEPLEDPRPAHTPPAAPERSSSSSSSVSSSGSERVPLLGSGGGGVGSAGYGASAPSSGDAVAVRVGDQVVAEVAARPVATHA